MFGFIESLNISIPDDATWPSTNINADFSDASKKPADLGQLLWSAALNNTIFPSNVEVSIGFKIIENPHAQLTQDGSKVAYNYNLDGNGFTSGTSNYNKYPTRPSVVFVPQEDITKKDDIPVTQTTTTPAANKVTPKVKSKSKSKSKIVTPKATLTTSTVPVTNSGVTGYLYGGVTDNPSEGAALKKLNDSFKASLLVNTLSAKDIENLAAKAKRNADIGSQ